MIKTSLTSTKTLAHYDPNLLTSSGYDPTSVGMGAAIFHTLSDGKEKVIAYASTSQEQLHSDIKEAFSIIYGCRSLTVPPRKKFYFN